MDSHELFHQSRICIDTKRFHQIKDKLVESFHKKLAAGYRSPYHLNKAKPGDFLIQYPGHENTVHYHFDDNPSVIRRRLKYHPLNTKFVQSAFAVRICDNGNVPTFDTYLQSMNGLTSLDLTESCYPFYLDPDFHDDMIFIATPEELMLLTAKHSLPVPPTAFL